MGFGFSKKKSRKTGKFREVEPVFFGTRFRIGVVPFEKGKINRRQSEKLQFQLLKTKRFSVSTNICSFSILFNKIIVDFFGALKPTILVAQWTERLQILIEERLGLNVRIGEGPRRLVAVRWWPGWVT